MSLFAPRKVTDTFLVRSTSTPPGKSLTAKDVERLDRQRGCIGVRHHYLVFPAGDYEPGRPVTTASPDNPSAVVIAYVGAPGSPSEPQERTIGELLVQTQASYGVLKVERQ